jgi:hypothetical protein
VARVSIGIDEISEVRRISHLKSLIDGVYYCVIEGIVVNVASCTYTEVNYPTTLVAKYINGCTR